MARITLLAVLTVFLGATMALCQSATGHLQMVVHIKRRPGISREEFWKYWQTQHAPKVAPLAAHVGISRYQQVQVGGMIPPTEQGSNEPASPELVPFDGIAMFLYESPEVLEAMLKHPYYTEVIEPDEHKLIDKEAFNGGQVATFTGLHVEVVDDKKDVWVGDDGLRAKYQKLFETYI